MCVKIIARSPRLGTHDGMCKRHWKRCNSTDGGGGENMGGGSSLKDKPPPAEGASVYESILPRSIQHRPTASMLLSSATSQTATSSSNMPDMAATTTSEANAGEDTDVAVSDQPGTTESMVLNVTNKDRANDEMCDDSHHGIGDVGGESSAVAPEMRVAMASAAVDVDGVTHLEEDGCEMAVVNGSRNGPGTTPNALPPVEPFSEGASVMPLVVYLRANRTKPFGWHRILERRARGVFPLTSLTSQLEPWERQLVLFFKLYPHLLF